MTRKNEIIIRTQLGMILFFLISSILSIYLWIEYKELYCLIMAFFLSILSTLSFQLKITLDLGHLNNGILTVDSGIVTRDFNVDSLVFYVSKPFIILKDGKNTIWLEKNRRLIRELKKLGALKKELA